MRLARLLHELMPDEPAVLGLLALLLLQDSRRPARFDADGDLVLLADQDRRAVAPAVDHRRASCSSARGCGARRTGPTPTSSRPRSPPATPSRRPAADTDWAAVLSWYDVLLTVQDTPVVRLNRAVAVGECDGPAAALAELDALPGLAGYPLWHATRAELLVRLEDPGEARTAFEAALALPMPAAQRAHVADRLGHLQVG